MRTSQVHGSEGGFRCAIEQASTTRPAAPPQAHHQREMLQDQEHRQRQQGGGQQYAKHHAPGTLCGSVAVEQLCSVGWGAGVKDEHSSNGMVLVSAGTLKAHQNATAAAMPYAELPFSVKGNQLACAVPSPALTGSLGRDDGQHCPHEQQLGARPLQVESNEGCEKWHITSAHRECRQKNAACTAKEPGSFRHAEHCRPQFPAAPQRPPARNPPQRTGAWAKRAR